MVYLDFDIVLQLHIEIVFYIWLRAVASEHARLESKGGRLFCSAIAPCDADDLLAPTGVWLNGVELRSNVSYMVAPGNELSFGEKCNAYVAEFDAADSAVSGGQGMSEMLMRGLAQQASPEVQKIIKENLDKKS